MSVYKIRSFTVALQNRIILKKGFEIYIVNKVIEIEYFGPYWIDQRKDDCRITMFDFSKGSIPSLRGLKKCSAH